MSSRLRTAAILAAAGLGLGGCSTYDDYGYGYGGVSAGYGSGYCDPYWDDCRYARSYDPWYGWYGNYYYPGIGFYVYDRGGRRYRWSDDHRRYWEGRRHHWRDRNWNDRRWERWEGYRRDGRDGRDWRDRDRRDGDRWRDRDRRDWRDRSDRRDWNERSGEFRRQQATPDRVRVRDADAPRVRGEGRRGDASGRGTGRRGDDWRRTRED